MRVLIADDEEFARRRLKQLMARHDDLQLVGECGDGRRACELIGALRPGLVFLDMDMPELDGLGVVRAVGLEAMPATVFATAYDDHALAAFDANAVDYLLKPFDQQRFDRALEKVRRHTLAQQRAGIGAALQDLNAPERILVRGAGGQHMLPLAEITHIAAEGNYVRLNAAAGSWLVRDSLAAIMQRLDPARFRRIHRSHIVNVTFVLKVLPWLGGDAVVVLADGRKLRMSRNFRAAFEKERC